MAAYDSFDAPWRIKFPIFTMFVDTINYYSGEPENLDNPFHRLNPDFSL